MSDEIIAETKEVMSGVGTEVRPTGAAQTDTVFPNEAVSVGFGDLVPLESRLTYAITYRDRDGRHEYRFEIEYDVATAGLTWLL